MSSFQISTTNNVNTNFLPFPRLTELWQLLLAAVSDCVAVKKVCVDLRASFGTPSSNKVETLTGVWGFFFSLLTDDIKLDLDSVTFFNTYKGCTSSIIEKQSKQTNKCSIKLSESVHSVLHATWLSHPHIHSENTDVWLLHEDVCQPTFLCCQHRQEGVGLSQLYSTIC